MTKRAVILLLALTLLIFTANAFARQVSDEIGRAVEIPESLNRIVSLTPSLTETLFALGLGNRLVGVTTWSNYPEKAKDIPKVGTYVSPSLETIVALRPDLVIADKVCNPPSVVHSLEAGGMPVYVVNSEDPFDLPKQFLRLGEICGAPEKARLMAQDMERQWTEEYLKQGDIESYYYEISEVIREFFGNLYNFDSIEMTSDELINQLATIPTPGLEISKLRNFLNHTDIIKFSENLPTPENCSQILDDAYYFVKTCKPNDFIQAKSTPENRVVNGV